jgi:hypothetical protein
MFSFDWLNIILGFSSLGKVLDQGIGNLPRVILGFWFCFKDLNGNFGVLSNFVRMPGVILQLDIYFQMGLNVLLGFELWCWKCTNWSFQVSISNY